MKTYIALLRGINVSGKNKIKMTELSSMLEKIGCVAVKTYIQSGNAVFKHAEKDSSKIQEQLEKKLHDFFGAAVPVLVLTSDVLQKICNQNPFEDITNTHVTLLADTSDTDILNTIEVEKFSPDVFIYKSPVIYLQTPNGYGNTKLTNTFFEKKLKTTATTRNWKTMCTLLEMVRE